MSVNKNLGKDTEEMVGKSFDDMTIDQMTAVQGAGDVEAETTPVSAVAASVYLSIQLTKTFKGKC